MAANRPTMAGTPWSKACKAGEDNQSLKIIIEASEGLKNFHGLSIRATSAIVGRFAPFRADFSSIVGRNGAVNSLNFYFFLEKLLRSSRAVDMFDWPGSPGSGPER